MADLNSNTADYTYVEYHPNKWETAAIVAADNQFSNNNDMLMSVRVMMVRVGMCQALLVRELVRMQA